MACLTYTIKNNLSLIFRTKKAPVVVLKSFKILVGHSALSWIYFAERKMFRNFFWHLYAVILDCDKWKYGICSWLIFEENYKGDRNVLINSTENIFWFGKYLKIVLFMKWENKNDLTVQKLIKNLMLPPTSLKKD